MKRAIQDLFVSTFGLITSILTAVLLFLIEWYFEVSLYTFMFWVVIPVGAIGAGFLAAGGYYLGARLFNHRPSPLILLNMVLISVGAFFLIHYLSYTTLDIDGVPIRTFVPFGTYLDTIITKTSMSVGFRLRSVAETGEVGSWGYIIAIVQIIGFAIGGIAVYGWLASQAYCEKCSRYLSKKAKQIRYFIDSDSFKEMILRVEVFFANDKLQEVIDTHTLTGMPTKGNNYLKSMLELKQCKRCGVQWLNFSCHKKERNSWKEIDGLAFSKFYNGEPLIFERHITNALELDKTFELFAQQQSKEQVMEQKTEEFSQSTEEHVLNQRETFESGKCPQCGEEIDKSLTKCFSCDFDFYENKLM